jgi:hypothetical protein
MSPTSPSLTTHLIYRFDISGVEYFHVLASFRGRSPAKRNRRRQPEPREERHESTFDPA